MFLFHPSAYLIILSYRIKIKASFLNADSVAEHQKTLERRLKDARKTLRSVCQENRPERLSTDPAPFFGAIDLKVLLSCCYVFHFESNKSDRIV